MKNIYPPWWDTTVTIYNRYEDPQTKVVTWFKNTVDGCFWKYQHDKLTIGQTVLESNKTICRIRKDERFLEAYAYRDLVNTEKPEYFTLAKGDIVIKGDVSDTIDEYTKGHYSTDLVKKYKALQGCIEIDHVSVNANGGRAGMSEHYLVEGV